MFLIYTDETGKDLKKGKDGTYRDGPFFIYGGLTFSEEKIPVVESAFRDMCKEILDINPFYSEVHTGDIFYRKKQFERVSWEQSKEFFRELLQLLRKFKIPLIVGLVYKDATIFKHDDTGLKNLYKISSAFYSFLTAFDFFLLEKNEFGLIIADNIDEGERKKGDRSRRHWIEELSDISNLIGKNRGVKLSYLFRRIFFEKISRVKEISFEPILRFRYKYKSQLYSVLDNVLYIDSYYSILNQMSDVVLFLFNLYLEVVASLIYGEFTDISFARVYPASLPEDMKRWQETRLNREVGYLFSLYLLSKNQREVPIFSLPLMDIFLSSFSSFLKEVSSSDQISENMKLKVDFLNYVGADLVSYLFENALVGFVVKGDDVDVFDYEIVKFSDLKEVKKVIEMQTKGT